MKRNSGFRFWFYFRSGWSSYFAFIFAAINTLVVTYYLAIERYPSLAAISPNFIQYVVIIVSIGIPLLILIGYAHWKRTPAYRSEADIWMESNPYQARMLVNSEILLQLNLKLTMPYQDYIFMITMWCLLLKQWSHHQEENWKSLM